MNLLDCPDITFAEAKAVIYAVWAAVERGFHQVIVECDSKSG